MRAVRAVPGVVKEHRRSRSWVESSLRAKPVVEWTKGFHQLGYLVIESSQSSPRGREGAQEKQELG